MKTLRTKVPNRLYELVKKEAEEKGLTISAFLRALIAQYFGYEVDQKVDLSPTYCVSREEFEELKRRVDQLEAELKRVAGISYYISRRKRG